MHIITRLDMGGSAQNTLLTCLGQAGKYKVTLVHGLSLESRMTPLEEKKVEGREAAARQKGVKIVPLPSLMRAINPVKDIQALVLLCRLMRREKPAVVHTHTSKAGILGRLAAKISGVPVVLHTPHGHVFYGHFNRMLSRLFRIMERHFGRITDGIVALTEGEKKDYVDLAVYPLDRITVIHSGVEIQRFSEPGNDPATIKAKLRLNPGCLVVGTVGWLLPIKGPWYLLKAMETLWQSLPEVCLIYVGKGALEQELRSEAFRLGVADRVYFWGWRDDVHEILQIMDVFVLPSLNEGMGRALVEAMAAGKPVVASRVGGVPDLVKHGKNGFLAKPGDIADLSYYIGMLLKDAHLRADMGSAGKTISQNYSLQKMMEKMDALYTTFLQRKGCMIKNLL